MKIQGAEGGLQGAEAVLTHGEAELQHVHGSFLLQEVHEAKEEVLLLPDLLQLQLQHLQQEEEEETTVSAPGCRGRPDLIHSTQLTDGFLLLTSAYLCRNGTRADGGSVAGSGWRSGRRREEEETRL